MPCLLITGCNAELLHLEESGRSSDSTEHLASVDETVDDANEKAGESGSSGGTHGSKHMHANDSDDDRLMEESATDNDRVGSKESLHHCESSISTMSANIPLQRIAMAANYSKRSGGHRDILKEGWMVHFTSSDPMVRMVQVQYCTIHCNFHQA